MKFQDISEERKKKKKGNARKKLENFGENEYERTSRKILYKIFKEFRLNCSELNFYRVFGGTFKKNSKTFELFRSKI